MARKKRNRNHSVRGERNNITMIGESKIVLPNDGTAIEVKLPECIDYFISEDGKLMFQKQQQEPANAPENFGITYDEIADRLFLDKDAYFHRGFGKVEMTHKPNIHDFAIDEENCKSESQVRKYLAYNKLLNIASYLNGGWTPTFGNFEKEAYAIGYDKDGNVSPIPCYSYNVGLVLFPSPYICEQAIRIMGKKSIHYLLSYEY